MTADSINIITDPADIARHQANVEAFLADRRNQPVFLACVEADFSEDITAEEAIDAVMLELGLTRIEAAKQLAKLDFAAALKAIAP